MTTMKQLSIFLAVALFAVVSVRADPPPAPVVTTIAYVNGKMNVAVWYKTGTLGNTSGSNLSYTYEVGMKRTGEDWTDVTSKGSFNTYDKNNYRFRTWTMTTNYVGEVEYRIRAKDSSTSETSDWVELGAVRATVNVKGTPIYGNNCNGNGFDGYIHTMVDATGDSGNDKYIGYVFDEPTRIKAIRYLPRLDHAALSGRYRNSLFQTASDATFADAETVHTVPSNFSTVTGMTEVVFAEPITAKAIRHYKASGGYESTAELEFIPADMPVKPSLSIGWTEVTNFHAVVTWSFPADFHCSTCRLERALHKEGPWMAQSAWLDPATDSLCVTNDDLYVGITCYYRVAAYTDHPYFPGELVHSAISEYTRMRRLDRTWADEAHLYNGIAIMRGTNGADMTTGSLSVSRAFDGNTGTWPDIFNAFAHGPVGLDFGENVWVGAFGYICRNDNACYARVGNTALYSASGEDVELLDKVQRSANVSRYSKDTTFYCEPVTEIPTAGERCWFLFGNSSSRAYGSPFYCNVAEVAFFGWTVADKAAAPVVSAPASITFARGATGPVISWLAGNHVQSYTLRRRERGTDEWTDVTTLPSSTLSYTDAGLAQGFYEYCVVADGGELGTVTSDVFSYAWYVAGNGTGLSGVVMWPYCSTNMLPWQMTQWAARGPEVVDINLAAGAEIASGVSAHARIAWEGTLIVPFSGTYTFTLETDAGGAVAVDNVFACNSWTDGTKIPSGSLSLSAGEHAIRVDYRLAEGDAPTKKCILRWSGVVQEEVIPASQLLPATTPPSPQIDGWTCLSYAMNRVGMFVKTGTGTYKVTASAQNMGTPNKFNAAYMWKKMPSSFAIETKINEGNGYGFGGIMIQGDNGHFIAPYFYVNGGNSYYGLKKFEPGDASWSQPVSWIQFGNNSNYDCYLRVEKRGPDVTCLWKDRSTDPWTTVYTCTAPVGMFGREVAVGFTVNGYTGANPAQFTFSEIDLREINSPTIVIFR